MINCGGCWRGTGPRPRGTTRCAPSLDWRLDRLDEERARCVSADSGYHIRRRSCGPSRRHRGYRGMDSPGRGRPHPRRQPDGQELARVHRRGSTGGQSLAGALGARIRSYAARSPGRPAARRRWSGTATSGGVPAAMAVPLRRAADRGQRLAGEFDLVADDLRAAAAASAGAGRPGARHHLAHPPRPSHHHARRFPSSESRGRTDRTAAALAAQAWGRLPGNCETRAHRGPTEGNGALAFDLVLASAESGRRRRETARGRAVALASAAIVADRFGANFPDEKPHELLCRLVTEAAEAAPAQRSGRPACVPGGRRLLDRHTPRRRCR